MNDKVILADGFAYCEVKAIYDKSFTDKSPLLSKAGDPMINISWSAVDCKGRHGPIKDFVVSSMVWKIKNIENALNINGLYNMSTKTFNVYLLNHACCGAVIYQDDNPLYGSKIKMYVPMAFYNLVNSKDELEKVMENNSGKLLTPSATISQLRDDDDDIPF